MGHLAGEVAIQWASNQKRERENTKGIIVTCLKDFITMEPEGRSR